MVKVNPPYSRARHTLFCKKCGTFFTPPQHLSPPPPPRLEKMTLRRALCGDRPPPCPLRDQPPPAATPSAAAAADASSAAHDPREAGVSSSLPRPPTPPPPDAVSAASRIYGSSGGPAHNVIPVVQGRPPWRPPLRTFRGLAGLVTRGIMKLPSRYPAVDDKGRRWTHYCVDCDHFFHVPHVCKRTDPEDVYPSRLTSLDVRNAFKPAFDAPVVGNAVTQHSRYAGVLPPTPAGETAFPVSQWHSHELPDGHSNEEWRCCQCTHVLGFEVRLRVAITTSSSTSPCGDTGMGWFRQSLRVTAIDEIDTHTRAHTHTHTHTHTPQPHTHTRSARFQKRFTCRQIEY